MEFKKFLLSLLGILVIGGIIIYLIIYATRTNAERSYEIEKKNLVQDFIIKNAWMRVAKNKAQYSTEITALVKSHISKIKELYTKYGKEMDIDRKWREYTEGGKETGTQLAMLGEKADKKYSEQRAAMEEAFKYSKEVFQMFLEARYNPIYTATDESVRLDFYEISRVQEGGNTHMRWKFIMWGAFPEMRYPGIAITLYDENGKKFGEINSSSSQPNLRVEDPTIWVEDFPPLAMPGYYDLPLIPYPVAKMDMEFRYSAKTYFGSEVSWSLIYKDVPVEPSWKLPPDAKWEAQAVEETPPEFNEDISPEKMKKEKKKK
jgi:hypothetical protein